MPCPGRCDQPVPVMRGPLVLVGESADALEPAGSPFPPPAVEGNTECVFEHIRDEGRATLDGYRATGGYSGLEQFVNTPTQLLWGERDWCFTPAFRDEWQRRREDDRSQPRAA